MAKIIVERMRNLILSFMWFHAKLNQDAIVSSGLAGASGFAVICTIPIEQRSYFKGNESVTIFTTIDLTSVKIFAGVLPFTDVASAKDPIMHYVTSNGGKTFQPLTIDKNK